MKTLGAGSQSCRVTGDFNELMALCVVTDEEVLVDVSLWHELAVNSFLFNPWKQTPSLAGKSE